MPTVRSRHPLIGSSYRSQQSFIYLFIYLFFKCNVSRFGSNTLHHNTTGHVLLMCLSPPPGSKPGGGERPMRRTQVSCEQDMSSMFLPEAGRIFNTFFKIHRHLGPESSFSFWLKCGFHVPGCVKKKQNKKKKERKKKKGEVEVSDSRDIVPPAPAPPAAARSLTQLRSEDPEPPHSVLEPPCCLHMPPARLGILSCHVWLVACDVPCWIS